MSLDPTRSSRSSRTGGMGESIAPATPKLRREVALKVRPEEVARGSPPPRHVEREARTVPAQPSEYRRAPFHPRRRARHASSHGADSRPNPRSTDQAKGCPEGPSRVAIALADALGGGAREGSCTRDLKPSNDMVTDDGRREVMEFRAGEDTRDRQVSIVDLRIAAGPPAVRTGSSRRPEIT